MANKEAGHRINSDIRSNQVRLISADGQQLGVMPTTEAMEHATAENLDLVEIAPDADPVVCKLLDYGKYKYWESKRQHEAKSKQKQTLVKEVKYRLKIGEADYQTKLRNVKRFIEAGDKVKLSLWLRGREIVRKDRSLLILKRVAEDMRDAVEVEQEPKLEGKNLIMMLSPKKKGRKVAEEQSQQ